MTRIVFSSPTSLFPLRLKYIICVSQSSGVKLKIWITHFLPSKRVWFSVGCSLFSVLVMLMLLNGFFLVPKLPSGDKSCPPWKSSRSPSRVQLVFVNDCIVLCSHSWHSVTFHWYRSKAFSLGLCSFFARW